MSLLNFQFQDGTLDVAMEVKIASFDGISEVNMVRENILISFFLYFIKILTLNVRITQ